MTFEYLCDRLHDEIEGSIDYLKMALTKKYTNKNIADVFYNMADGELEHAKNVYKLFNDKYYEYYERATENTPNYIVEMKNDMDKCYQKEYPNIRYLMELYSKS